MLISITQLLPNLLLSVIAMTFLTLLERKSLAFMQLRKGPNKSTMAGLTQPVADALKLMTKTMMTPKASNTIMTFLAPMISFTLSLTVWYLYPASHLVTHKSLGLLLLICILATKSYSIILAGWGTNSKYALIGAMRIMAQSISYEVPMILTLIFFSIISHTLDLTAMNEKSHLTFKWSLITPMTGVWLTIMLAETNRTPFDFSEGESELVSGFNVEYSGVKFTALIMGEYLDILFMSILSSVLLTNSLGMSFPIILLFLLIRGSAPRYRYDLMMYTAWKVLIPTTLSFTLLITVVFFTLN
uniref:NADH-ubiquinone oxidoreductase chain 1 n=1 Tax=Venustaconcha ellipsiformis TaxID=301928 RepID=D2DW10_VENEL|nr:NADH dehydrogenase subunit 1 [Venustaconcha ellipsiformis]ACQ91036.1 NADH dehydrogenase subunit 1 [Venustaconcha ellipsiformis]